MRLTQLRERLTEAFGLPAADVFAEDHVLARLGNRTVNQALAAGLPAREVWRAVWEEMQLPPKLR